MYSSVWYRELWNLSLLPSIHTRPRQLVWSVRVSPGDLFNIRYRLTSIGIPIVEIKPSCDRLIATTKSLMKWFTPSYIKGDEKQGPSQYKDGIHRYRILILNIRRSWDRLIFIMWIPYWYDGAFILRRPQDLNFCVAYIVYHYIGPLWCWDWLIQHSTFRVSALCRYGIIQFS